MSIKNGRGGKATEAATKWRWLYRQLFQVEASKAIYEQRRIRKSLGLFQAFTAPCIQLGPFLPRKWEYYNRCLRAPKFMDKGFSFSYLASKCEAYNEYVVDIKALNTVGPRCGYSDISPTFLYRKKEFLSLRKEQKWKRGS
ncbi:hypothetical protein CEXT_50851 [Caerostris extrusa]|uniref:Uncharacterized protein n=1 Tax=Caerostris extrusa TaxID=172846 RepID=A0AAV4MWS5_CAEEX|nr:hypothetical protein CEXT_50851 [Caerostris extrusa]